MKVQGKNYRAVWMVGRNVVVINQPLLRHRLWAVIRLKNHYETVHAIKAMIIRGAGTIGATAAHGMAQAFLEGVNLNRAYCWSPPTGHSGQPKFLTAGPLIPHWVYDGFQKTR